MNIMIKQRIKQFYNLSKKFTHNSNYYFDFHKDKALTAFPHDFENLVSPSMQGDDYKIHPPYMHTESVFASRFAREVVAILLNPKLLDNQNISKEAKEKAKGFLNVSGFSVGAYSDSQGIVQIRKNLVKWYLNRDGYKPEETDFYLTYGRINSYEHVLTTLAESGDGIIIPNPCYPFYANFNRAMGLENILYNYDNLHSGEFSDASKKLKINFGELQDSLIAARKSKPVKAMLVINPQDPLGEILSYSQMEEIVDLCQKNHLVLIACESLQHSIYPSKVPSKSGEGFLSFRHVVNKLNSELELFSIQSLSQGPFYNCGIKSGLLDCLNIDPEVRKQIYKFKSIDLCSGVAGQIFLDLNLNRSNELGSEFLTKYEKSISDFKNQLQFIKNKVFEQLRSQEELTVRDIDSGLSFFIRNKNSANDKFIVKGHQLATTKGSIYGKNLDDFTCVHLDENLLEIFKI